MHDPSRLPFGVTVCDVHRFMPQGYLPGQLYNLNSKFGNQEELVSLVAAFKEAGVRPVCEFLDPNAIV